MSTCFSAQSAAAADSDLPARSQKQLIAAAKSGRRAPLGKLCERHRKPVSWGTRRIMRKPEDAGDAAQECFLNAFFERKDFDGRSQFATWLTRIAVNAALMKRRKKRGARAFPIDEPNPSSAPVPQREFRCDSRSAKEVLPSWRETDREVSHFGAAAASSQRGGAHLLARTRNQKNCTNSGDFDPGAKIVLHRIPLLQSVGSSNCAWQAE